MFTHLKEYPQLFQRVIDDVAPRLMAEVEAQKLLVYDAKHTEVMMWSQTWSDSSCGFGGLGLQAFWTTPTVVIYYDDLDIYFVYHNGRFAYQQTRPSDRFLADMNNHQLAGAENRERQIQYIRDDDD